MTLINLNILDRQDISQILGIICYSFILMFSNEEEKEEVEDQNINQVKSKKSYLLFAI